MRETASPIIPSGDTDDFRPVFFDGDRSPHGMIGEALRARTPTHYEADTPRRSCVDAGLVLAAYESVRIRRAGGVA
jgi:hypothetical protein